MEMKCQISGPFALIAEIVLKLLSQSVRLSFRMLQLENHWRRHGLLQNSSNCSFQLSLNWGENTANTLLAILCAGNFWNI